MSEEFQSPSPYLTRSSLNAWEVIFAVDTVTFFLALFPFVWVVWRHWNNKNTTARSLSVGFFFRFFILAFSKFVGGAIGVAFAHDVKQGQANKNLLIATLVLFSISLGFFIISLQKLTEYRTGVGKGQVGNTRLRMLLEKFAHISIILNVIGSVTSYQTDSRSSARGLLIAGCVGFLVATLLELEKLIRFGDGRTYILLLVIPFLIARISYSLVSAANINLNPSVQYPSSKYSILLGKWEYYFFWGFIEEVIITALFLFELVADVM